MVTRLDHDLGELLDLLKELKIDSNTLVMIAGDNGSAFAPESDLAKLFDQSMGSKLRGCKRSMYEGGLRQAAMAWWPGQVPAGRETDEPWAFWDFLPTAVELAGAKLPDGMKTDGLSLVSFLKGGKAPQRDCFYWELHEKKAIQAIRFGDWKAVKNGPKAEIELYDLSKDSAEKNNLATTHPAEVKRAVELMKLSRTDDHAWPLE
jgi:arylsulfatase A-like enzyme